MPPPSDPLGAGPAFGLLAACLASGFALLWWRQTRTRDATSVDVAWAAAIGGTAIALAFVATLYPSWWAARVKPAEALRYE